MLLGTHKLRPTFFIGLGGSGGRVVDVLARRLSADPSFPRYADLVHFVAVDTDQNDLQRLHREVHKSNISIANKPRRIALHRGEATGLAEDRRVTSWVHPSYRFREHSNAGAGQIRLEARYSLHCQVLEQQPHNLTEILRRQLQRALRAGAPNRSSERVRFHLWASTAGGTGSGASLVVANLLRKLAAELGAEAEVFGNFFLPSLFRDRVAPALVAKIEANGYAALQEIERFQELRYEGGPDPIELVFDPLGAHDKAVAPTDRVERAPFDWVYLVDRPEAMTIEAIYAAAGEAAYLQLFTPILGYQEREADNFRQLQTRLAAGYFALQNGAIGASVIELPRERLVRYCARRATIDALERLVIAQGSDDAARIDLVDPAWKALSESEQGRRLDRAFVDFIRGEARREEAANQPGIFCEINRFESMSSALLDAFKALLKVELEAAEDLVAIDSINAAAITPENTSLNAQRDAMLRDLSRARAALSERAVALEKDLASGQLLTRFFSRYRVSPLCQRFLLIELDRMAREDQRLGGDDDQALSAWCIVPFDDAESGRHLALAPADPASWKLDQPELRRQLQALEAGLSDAARRLFKKEQAFAERRQAVVAWFNQLRDTAQETLIVEFWQRVQRALEQQVKQRLEVFRAIAKQGLGLVSHLRADAERSRARGLAVGDIADAPSAKTADDALGPDGVAGEFHLGSEVFHDERAGVRAWDELWRLVVEPSLHVPLQDLLPAIDRHLQAGDAERVLYRIAHDLDELHRERIARHLSVDQPLTLADALVLEARFALTAHQAPTKAALDAVALPRIRDYLADKIARVAGMSRALGRFDEPVVAGREFSPYRPRFVGVSTTHLERAPVIAEALGVGASGFERLEDWTSPDLVSFYQACLGVPLYAWVEVQGPLALAYAHESRDPLRKEPLHIDHRWEGDGLPGLDPVTRRVWEDARARLAAAGLTAVARALAAGVVHREGERFRWRLRGKEGDLGPSARHLATAWASLSDALREPLEEASAAILAAEPQRTPAMAATLAGCRFDAEADGHGLEAAAYGALARALTAPDIERRAA